MEFTLLQRCRLLNLIAHVFNHQLYHLPPPMVPDLHYFQCAFLKKSIVRGTTVLNSVHSRFRPCLSVCAAPHHTHLAANHKEPCPTSCSDALKNLIWGVQSAAWHGGVVTQIMCTMRGLFLSSSHCLGANAGFSNDLIMNNIQ